MSLVEKLHIRPTLGVGRASNCVWHTVGLNVSLTNQCNLFWNLADFAFGFVLHFSTSGSQDLMQFFPGSCYVLPFRPKCISEHIILEKNLTVYSGLNVNYLLPHTHKPTDKVGVLYKLQFVIIHNSEDKNPESSQRSKIKI
jgi:hypothetical protein